MWKRSNKALIIGFVLGMIGPFIGAILFYMLKFNHVEFTRFVTQYASDFQLMVPLLSFGAIVNLGIFFLFLQINAPLASRGVIFATLLYAFFVVIVKFFL